MSDEGKEKTEVLFKLFEEGKQFTGELLKENERLRLLLAAEKAEGQASRISGYEGKGGSIEAISTKHREELEELKKNITDLELENQEFADKYVKVEQQNQNMASLYVSSYRLHSTLDFKEVVAIILEIVINLIGSEEFGVFLRDPEKNEFTMIAEEGLDGRENPPIQPGFEIAGKAAESGESFFAEGEGNGNGKDPLACVPLKVQDEVMGIIVIYRLLRQKDGFAPMDLDLFGLLADHAATALYSSQLHSRSERKLSTMKNLMELLKT